ncbi:MAG TPA: class I SAM-dependent methyltransferase [Mycobacteriales bacterium]|jgi:SAM-dependent methyltransferase|nr:class I SAM-dependent methyltransferase [Mycobacteriales bacterium]
MGDATESSLPEHARANRQLWDSTMSSWYGQRALAQWAAEPHWGIWAIPQTQLPVLPEDLAGKDLIDLGCGTAYIGAWAAKQGARPAGIDNSAKQLAVAQALQDKYGIHFPLIHGNAEDVPAPTGTFDVAISEHGASAWCDPYKWIPEAARLLRPGGQLVFMRNSTLLQLCSPETGPADTTLRQSQFGLNRIEQQNGAVIYQLPTGPMVRLLHKSGFILEDLIEVQTPEDATTDYDYAALPWAHLWPSEEVWKARRAG